MIQKFNYTSMMIVRIKKVLILLIIDNLIK